MTQNNATITIANQSFPSFRTELNQTLQDIYTNFAGSADPNATNVAFAGSLYYDTDDNILKLRNEDADAYISLFTTDQSADTAVPTNLNVVVDTTPQLGGTLDTNGQLVQFGDSSGATDDRLQFGASQDLLMYHDGSNSYITDNGTGSLKIGGTQIDIEGTSVTIASFVDDGAVTLYHNNSAIIATSANGVTVTGTAVATTDTDTSNSGTVDLDFSTKQNFVLTLTGNITSLTASNEQVGQSGFIVFIQDGTGGRTVSLHGDYETAGGAGLTLSSAASTTDIVPYVVAAASRILLGTPQKAFS